MSLQTSTLSDPLGGFNVGNFDDEVKIVIRVDPGRGRKKVTTVSGFSSTTYKKEDIKKMSKTLKSKCACACSPGQVSEEDDISQPYCLTLQGDHAQTVKKFLINKKYATEEEIEIRGIAS